MLATALHEHREQGRDDERRGEADHEGDDQYVWRRSRADGHLPTATFRSARAACRIRTPGVVDPADAAELGRLLAHHLDRPLGHLGLAGDPVREQHDRDHDHRGHGDHDDAEHEARQPPAARRDQHAADATTEGRAVQIAAGPSPAYDEYMRFASVDELEGALRDADYLPDRGLATSIFLALEMRRPLLLEGEAGVGKTEVAKTLSRLLGADLIRLQCYEGIDASQALYEWDYARQLLYARALQAGEIDVRAHASELYGPDFLVERPLLKAIRAGAGAVLLIDELDRADDEFEAFLLEILSDYTVTVPEIGTIAAAEPPAVVVTSNRTRELHDALKRRCLYHWIEFPDLEREVEIIRLRAPEVPQRLARSVAEAVPRLRDLDLVKPPGAAEAIDWARALALLGADEASGPERCRRWAGR